MFWFSLVVVVLGGLIASPLIRAWIRKNLTGVEDRWFEIGRIAFILIAAFYSSVIYFKTEQAKESMYRLLSTVTQSLEHTKNELQSASDGLKSEKTQLSNTRSQLESVLKEKQEFEELKRTPPIVRATLFLAENRKLYLQVVSENLIPISFKWYVGIVNKNDQERKRATPE